MTYSYECLECGFTFDSRYLRRPGCPRCGARLWPTGERRRRSVAGAVR